METAAAVDDQEERERPPRPRSKVLESAREDDAADVLAWVASQAPDSSFRLRIVRKSPQTGPNGENIVGILDTVEERPDDLVTYMRERWGGGTYSVTVEVPNRKGGWQYARATSVKISGDPKLDPKFHGGGRAAAQAAPATEPLADRAFNSAERFAQNERDRADRLERELRERPAGPDMSIITSLTSQIDSLQRQLMTMATKEPPKDTFRDKILEQAVAGESTRIADLQRTYDARLDKMRDDHASELRQLRENHADTIKRAEDRHDKAQDASQRNHDRAITDLTKAHDRAIDDLRKAHDRELRQSEKSETTAQKTLEAAHQARIEAMQAENKRLTSEIVGLKAEVGALREKKDKSPAEQLKELSGIKESLDNLTGGGGADGDKPWYAQLAEGLGNSEAVLRVIDRIGGGKEESDGAEGGGGPAQAAPPRAPAHPPVGAFVRNPADNRMYRHVGDGQYAGPIDENKLRALVGQRAKKRAAALAAQQATQAGQQAASETPEETLQAAEDAVDAAMAEIDNGIPKPAKPPAQVAAPAPRPATPVIPIGKPPKPPTPDEIKMAVLFIENAFTGKKSPEDVARSARSLVSGGTLQYIGSVGADPFLDAVAKVKPGSPLVTQLGRTFVRQVAAHLFGP